MTYEKLAPEENTFSTIHVDVTHRCNMRCANCYLPNRTIPDMDFSKLRETLSLLPFKTTIRLIGAEPTMRDDLPEIIKMIRELRHTPSLITNGLKLSDPSYVKTLKESGLRMVGLSMNGGDNDELYKLIDNGRYAEKKVQALGNLLEQNMIVHIACIVAKGVNEDVISNLVALVRRLGETLKISSRAFSTICIRVKTIAPIGRHMENHSYTFSELVEVTAKQLGITKDEVTRSTCLNATNSPDPRFRPPETAKDLSRELTYLVPIESKRGTFHLRFVDWSVNQQGVPNYGSTRRGRITEDWKIAPFFEDVKANEFNF